MLTQRTRRQLSLFVPDGVCTELEAARRILDPVQSQLIPVHVTLCREDELAQADESGIRSRLANIPFEPITLHFGRPEAFRGHGILLNCIGGEDAFRLLREHVLGSRHVRIQRPHITLAHPRNPQAPGNSLVNASRLPDVIAVTFPTVCLIEQVGCAPWKLLEGFNLRG